MRKLVLIAGLVAFSFPAIGQDTVTRVTPDALTWKDNTAFPKGVQIATLVGDPTKAGDVVVLSSHRTFKCHRTLTLIPRS
jgi:multidrug efflux pump subunit AcrA (membrane-fusion protein)